MTFYRIYKQSSRVYNFIFEKINISMKLGRDMYTENKSREDRYQNSLIYKKQ